MRQKETTLLDLANALGISTGTVHRALHNHPEVSEQTKTRVLQVAKSMEYRPNVAARNLARRRRLRISVITPKGTTSFWELVRAGIQNEAASQQNGGTELEFRTNPKMGEGEAEAFEASLASRVDGIITFPSQPKEMGNWIKRAGQLPVPVVCVATDAPESERLGVVSIDTKVSGSLAADLLGHMLPVNGKVAITLADFAVNEHAEKADTFMATMHKYHPEVSVVERIEDHGIDAIAYEKCKKLFSAHPDLNGIYVATESSIPVLNAARDTGISKQLSIVATDLFPALIEHIRQGNVLGTIDQRPYTQGRLAFQVLHQYLMAGSCPSYQILLSPHLVMQGNLDFFLHHNSHPSSAEIGPNHAIDPALLEGYTQE